MVTIKVKWNKCVYDTVSVDLEATGVNLKENILKLTGVPIDRQKLMCKGAWSGTLKDDVQLASIPWKEGIVVTLMGTAEIIPTEAILKTVFIEDMTSAEKAEKGMIATSAGLNNLGNTCYMNATVQCMRHIPELRAFLRNANGPDMASSLNIALRDTFDQLDASETSISPARFVFTLRQAFPQFAERTSQGHFMQQDAEDFYNILSQTLRNGFNDAHGYESLLGAELEETLTCAETDAEPVVSRKETISKVVCSIHGGAGSSITVDHAHEGIKLWLEGSLEKHSSVLGRNAVWKRSARMSKLPKYLCVQFLRFFWKATPESADHAGIKCKILRPVSFPGILDVYEFCSDALKAELRANREREDKAVEEAVKRSKADSTDGQASASAASAPVPEDLMVTDEDEAAALQEALKMSLGEDVTPSILERSGLPSGFTGSYELHSLVTHKGRSADSGHYIGWTRQGEGSNMWWKFDDDKVSEVSTDDIFKLKGGGDWDMAYLAFYRFKGSNH